MPNLKSKLLILTLLALLVSSISVAHANKRGHSYAPYANSNKTLFNNKSRYVQNKIRSRSDVVNEVKQRYNAKVLKVSLNEKAGVYKVRMLMPNGKVRSIQVSAY